MIFCYVLLSTVFSFSSSDQVTGNENPFQIEKQKIHSQNLVDSSSEDVIALPAIKLQTYTTFQQNLTLGKTFSFGKYGDYFVADKEIFKFNSTLNTWISIYKHELKHHIDFISLDPTEHNLVILSGNRLLFFHLSKHILTQQFPLIKSIENPSSIAISKNEIQILSKDGLLVTIKKQLIFGTTNQTNSTAEVMKQVNHIQDELTVQTVSLQSEQKNISKSTGTHNTYFNPMITTGFIQIKSVRNELKSFQLFQLLNPLFFQTLSWNLTQSKTSIFKTYEKQVVNLPINENSMQVSHQQWNWSATVGSLYDTSVFTTQLLFSNLRILSPTLSKNTTNPTIFPFSHNILNSMSQLS